MKISKPELVQKKDELIYRVPVEYSEGNTTLWYYLSKEYLDLISEHSDPALVALLIPAMARGEDIHIAGTISEKLYYNVSGRLQTLLQYVLPSLQRVKIFPEDIQSQDKIAAGVATGFSGGIDSFSVLADHFYSNVPSGYKITHLLFNNVGSHSKGESLFRERYERLKPFVQKLGLPFIAVNTNLNDFYKGFTFLTTHEPRNVSVALMLQNGIGNFLFASAYSYLDVIVRANTELAYIDPIILPLFSTETLDAFSVGSEYTRVEKTLQVAKVVDSYSILEVCAGGQNAGNCSTCWKCMRTLLTLEIVGLLDLYRGVFDIQAYKQARKRKRYIAQVLKSNGLLDREIVAFAKEQGYRFPLSSRIYALLYNPITLAKK